MKREFIIDIEPRNLVICHLVDFNLREWELKDKRKDQANFNILLSADSKLVQKTNELFSKLMTKICLYIGAINVKRVIKPQFPQLFFSYLNTNLSLILPFFFEQRGK